MLKGKNVFDALGLMLGFQNAWPHIHAQINSVLLKNGKVAVIDVNGAKSYGKGHIPTAIDFSSVGKNLASLLPKDKSTLVVS